ERAKLDNFSSNPNKSKVCTSLCIPLLLAPNLPLLLARQQRGFRKVPAPHCFGNPVLKKEVSAHKI
ncbi:MAG: hypothetical protein PF904_09085, partial [Kiritimatiellae bacterium]|nr:hypothetical protein [Kiritimatiellia bacterium]